MAENKHECQHPMLKLIDTLRPVLEELTKLVDGLELSRCVKENCNCDDCRAACEEFEKKLRTLQMTLVLKGAV